MKKGKYDSLISGITGVFALAVIGGMIADSGGLFSMQRFDLVVAAKHDENARITAWPTVEDTQGNIYTVQGGGMYRTPGGLTWDDTTSLLGKIEEGQTYCAIKGEPVLMRKHGGGQLIGIYAKDPCPK